ncbi:MAG: hypothetical protein ACREGJ_02990 [Candidatus Saccharimonadales bacterium]
MNKDVIYIDTEDDITAIIGKVKAAGEKIVALVPPKRVGVLQSAVNLKLLQKAASEAQKRVVLITNDHSLTALAAGVKMPVAKNLQSRPEIPDMAEPQTPDEEVINGEELPVGEVASSLDKNKPTETISPAEAISEKVDLSSASAAPVPPQPSAAKPSSKLAQKGLKGVKGKIPNFDIFRKRLFLIAGGGILLIIFLVWALVFAPKATVTISAKTTAVNIDKNLSLEPGLQQSDVATLKLKPNVQQLKKSVATEFDATGSKEIGNKAGGTMNLNNGDSSDPVTVPAGTQFTAKTGGQKFTSNSAVTVPGAKVVGGSIKPGTASVAVTAAALGPEYNLAPQSYTVHHASGVTASGEQMSGGTRETVTVVSQEDVDKAKQQLAQVNVEEAKKELKKQITGDYIIIEESFTADQNQPAVSPNVGEQAKRAKVTVETVFTLVAIARAEAREILTATVNEALKDKPDQQSYGTGENSITFQSFQKLENGAFSAQMVTTGYIGPKIDTKQLSQQLAGKRYGEIQAIVNEIPGVDKVDIKFSPFWVTKAPGADKVEIKFSVANDGK